MNTQCVVPDWLHDIFLGYGNPAAAHYTQLVVWLCVAIVMCMCHLG